MKKRNFGYPLKRTPKTIKFRIYKTDRKDGITYLIKRDRRYKWVVVAIFPTVEDAYEKLESLILGVKVLECSP